MKMGQQKKLQQQEEENRLEPWEKQREASTRGSSPKLEFGNLNK